MESRRRNVKKSERKQSSENVLEKNSNKTWLTKLEPSTSIKILIVILVVVVLIVNILSGFILSLTTPDAAKSVCKFANLHKDAKSAISRAKSEQCKKSLNAIACMNPSDLYPNHIPSLCNFNIGEKDLKKAYLGCYRDSFEKRILNHSNMKSKENSPHNCIRYCTESGFPYSGMYLTKYLLTYLLTVLYF